MNTVFAIASVVIKELYRRKDFYVLFVLTALITVLVTPETTTVATDSLTTTVNVRANLQISKLAAATARASDLLTYTIVVTNAGPSLAPSIRITDVLPVSVTYLIK